MSLSQRKIINIFRVFIQKVFVPHLSKLDSICQQQWNKFNTLLSNDQLNMIQIQHYIDKIPSQFAPISRHEYDKNSQNKLLFSSNKIRKDSTYQLNTNTNNNTIFNPNKTFGGEKARILFPVKDFEEHNFFQHTNNKQPFYFNHNSNNNNNSVNHSNYNKDYLKDKEDGFNNNNQNGYNLTTQSVLPTLQKLFKVFSDNHSKMEKIGGSHSSNAYEHKNYDI